MTLRLVIVALVALGFTSLGSAADDFPYTAYVNTDDVNVRSGPGDNYYPVLKLNRGERVEVFRHDPGGWYAVRPPQGSFSWVSAEFIKPTGGNLGVVIGERVVARVGSAFSDVRDVIQVRLDRDEDVEILEAKRFNSGPAAQTWYKIAAPAGEFRWISGKYVAQELAVTTPRERSPRNNLILDRISRRTEREEESRESVDVEPRAERVSEGERDRWVERGDRAERRTARDEKYDPRGEEESPIDAPITVRQPHHADLTKLLDDLDLELSAMVAEETSVWDFTDVRARAERTLDKAETAVDRGKARVLLSKIARFEDIRKRYVAVMSTRNQTDRVNHELASNVAARERRPFSDSPRYDGVGRLAQVVSTKVGSPRYALLDETGEIRYYITPAPGVNLNSYIGQTVGVNGTLGFMPEQDRQHVTAKRIITVEGDTKLR